MFAAASGARLAHRHNKAVKKQISASHIEGLQVHYKGFQKQQQIKYSEIHANRFAGVPQRRPNFSSKLYCDSNLKISSSYVDINGRITKLGHVDFEGKAAWQDRELNHELEARESICALSEAAVTHRTKQREAHRRWVKRNRIHDLSFGECSSDEELLYGVQNSAANLLLYVGLGTMCVGMIIAFVGTGEKGFKTMELRLIGPALIGAGVLIIIFRIMLCVCPSKCLKLKKQKHKLKNSTNKLNSEGNQVNKDLFSSKEPLTEDSLKEKPENQEERKKRVSIAMLPTTSGLGINSSENLKPFNSTTRYAESPCPFVVPTISFLENEKRSKSKETISRKASNLKSSEDKEEEKLNFELKEFNESDYDIRSFESSSSFRQNFSNLPGTLVSPQSSDVSISSFVNESLLQDPVEAEKEAKHSKFEVSRSSKNVISKEIVLNPYNLNETNTMSE